jgi:hypothetical protein
MHSKENLHIEKIKKTTLENLRLFLSFKNIGQIFVMA